MCPFILNKLVWDLSLLFLTTVLPFTDSFTLRCYEWDALRDFVAFSQFKKRGKHTWNRDTFSKDAGLLKKSRNSYVF